MTYYLDITHSFISPEERTRLVRLCAALTGNSEAAEDLTQETLLEAWRHLDGLRDGENGIAFICPTCESSCVSLSDSIAQLTPEAQRFLRAHARVRTLPEREIEVAGRPAIVTTFESLTDNTHLDIVSALDSYETLHIYGGER